jgi:hypothetical protein
MFLFFARHKRVRGDTKNDIIHVYLNHKKVSAMIKSKVGLIYTLYHILII